MQLLAFTQDLKVGQEKNKTNAYFSLVRPQLEYATVLWDPYTQTYKNKIEMVQRQAARYVCNNYSCEASVTTMLKHPNWCSLQHRRANIRPVTFYKSLHGTVTLDFFPNLLITKKFIQYRFLIHTIANWNNLPANSAAQHQVWRSSDRGSPACNINSDCIFHAFNFSSP